MIDDIGDMREAMTGCIEKPTFAPDKKKKTLWKKIKEIWAKLNEDGKDDDNDVPPFPPAHTGDKDDDYIMETACLAAIAGANVCI